MKPICMAIMIAVATVCIGEDKVPLSPNDVGLPRGYQNWRLIGVSHRGDSDTLRGILGNYQAIEAARSGKTQPWPDGSILVKVVWEDRSHPSFDAATVPGNIVHVEMMEKNAKQFRKTGGWGFARWTGENLKPYGQDASFAKECFECHQTVEKNDYVFTRPVVFPE